MSAPDFAWQIIQEFAESDPTYLDADGWVECFFCGVEFQEEGPSPEPYPEHKRDCLWMRAKVTNAGVVPGEPVQRTPEPLDCSDCGRPLTIVSYPYTDEDWDYECRNDACLAHCDTGFPVLELWRGDDRRVFAPHKGRWTWQCADDCPHPDHVTKRRTPR